MIDNKTIKKLKYPKRRPSFKLEKLKQDINLFNEKDKLLLLNYFQCENIAKRLIKSAYLGSEYNEERLYLSNLKVALEYFDINIHHSTLNILFNTNYKVNDMLSLRKLRNDIVHQFKRSSILKLQKYYSIYNEKLTMFMNACCNCY